MCIVQVYYCASDVSGLKMASESSKTNPNGSNRSRRPTPSEGHAKDYLRVRSQTFSGLQKAQLLEKYSIRTEAADASALQSNFNTFFITTIG